MAIYHLSIKIISRGKGKSAVAAAAYRSASKLVSNAQKLEFDYSNKVGVEYSEIIAPDDVPDWVKDRKILWNKVEEAETRINSQLAREIEIAIPVELSKEQAVALVKEFVQAQFVSQGMIADVNIHRDNPENPHAHILLTTRETSKEGFTVKNRSWNDRSKIYQWREAWSQVANRYLCEAGHEVTIDHRSYKDQGLEIKPTFHLGYKLSQIIETKQADQYQAIRDYQAIIEKNAQNIIADPEIALEALTAQQSVFSDLDIAKFANRNSNTTEQYYQVVSAIKAHVNTVQLAKTEQGRIIYTSKQMLALEEMLIAAATELNVTNEHWVNDKYKEQALRTTWWEKFTGKQKILLNNGQLECLNYILNSGNLKIIVGYAGTGKSTLLSVAKDAWEGQGYRVLGTALAGIAAQNLEECGIPSRTIDSFLFSLDKKTIDLNTNDVLVIDEAGMVDSRRLAEVLLEAKAANAKVILLGDPEQLKPIQAGAPFRAIAERVGYIELDEIVRQNDVDSVERTTEMRQASKEFATQQTIAALDRYERLGNLHVHSTKQEAIDAVINAWHAGRKPKVAQIVLAYTRKDVAILNVKIREILQSEKVLKEQHPLSIKNRDGEETLKEFAVNERIYFIKNDKQLGVKNGSLGTIKRINNSVLTVLLDNGRTAAFNLNDYPYIDYGYAATVYKAQGITADRTYFLADKYLDRHATYVAATRHRSHLEIHYDTETFKDKQEFYRIVSREKPKDMALDFAQVRGLIAAPVITSKAREAHEVRDHITPAKTPSSYVQFDIKRIKEDLSARAEEVGLHYLGTPKEKSNQFLRYGSHHGSLVLTTKGAKQGSWYDFQTGECGDALSLIKYAANIADFKKVLEEAANFLGGKSTYVVAQTASAVQTTTKPSAEDTTLQDKIAKAQALAAQTQSLSGTLAEQYLCKHRGIDKSSLADSLRFHPNIQHPFNYKYYPALIAIVTDDKDQTCAVQATYLDAKTAKKAPITYAKITRGMLNVNNCGVLINKGREDVILVAEGIETALSIKMAQPDATIYAALGVTNFAHIPVSAKTKQVIFCADNDGKEAASQKLIEQAVAKLADKGVDVWLVMPAQAKQDFNDVLLLRGVDGVKDLLNKAQRYKVATKAKTPTEQPSKNISNDAIQKLRSYLKKYRHYEQLAVEAVRSFGKPQEQITKEQALAAKAAYQKEATAITKDQELWAALCQAHKNKILGNDFSKLGGTAQVEDRFLHGAISQDDFDVIVAHIRGAVSSMHMSRRRGRSR